MTENGSPTFSDRDEALKQERLREAMLGSRNWKERTQAQPSPAKRSKLWHWVVAAMVIVGAIAIARGVQGAEKRVYVLWDEGSDRQFHPHQFTSAVACLTDMPKETKGAPSGLRISCRQVKGE